MTIRLVIGSRNASPWSLATWLAMRMFKVPFEEVLVPLGRPETEGLLQRFSPSGRLPVLVDGSLTIWESLAILEYLAEQHPEMWPDDVAARATARSTATEMHAGLTALQTFLPLDMIARFAPPGRLLRAVALDVKRVREIWTQLRTTYGVSGGGPFLFGRFTIVDALSAPLASRFITYALPQDPVSSAYVETLMVLPPMREWLMEAGSEVAALSRTPAPPFHRSVPGLLAPAAVVDAKPLRATELLGAGQSDAAASEPSVAEPERMPDLPSIVAATPMPAPKVGSGKNLRQPEAVVAKAVPPDRRPRLDEVDRPLIAYLDEPVRPVAREPISPDARTKPPSLIKEAAPASPASHLDRPAAERKGALPAPGAAFARADKLPALPEPPADLPPQETCQSSRVPPSIPSEPELPVRGLEPQHSPASRAVVDPPIGVSSSQPAPISSRHAPDMAPRAAPAKDQPEATARPSDHLSPQVRLRRPGTPAADEASSRSNRFVRAIIGHRTGDADPPTASKSPLRHQPAAPPIASRRATPAGPDPVKDRPPDPPMGSLPPDSSSPPRTIRPSSIKPIGFSGHRRR